MGSELCTSHTCLRSNTLLYFAHPSSAFFYYTKILQNIVNYLCSVAGRPTSLISSDYSALSLEAPVSARFSSTKYHAIMRFFSSF